MQNLKFVTFVKDKLPIDNIFEQTVCVLILAVFIF